MADSTDEANNAAVATAEKPKSASVPKPRRLPPYNVVLLNDDAHTYEYVIEMLGKLFGHPRPRGFKLAEEVDHTGRAIVLTTSKEHAELKRDQILAFGADWRVENCVGAMSAVIEPAESS